MFTDKQNPKGRYNGMLKCPAENTKILCRITIKLVAHHFGFPLKVELKAYFDFLNSDSRLIGSRLKNYDQAGHSPQVFLHLFS